jgi:hypothetical protein
MMLVNSLLASQHCINNIWCDLIRVKNWQNYCWMAIWHAGSCTNACLLFLEQQSAWELIELIHVYNNAMKIVWNRMSWKVFTRWKMMHVLPGGCICRIKKSVWWSGHCRNPCVRLSALMDLYIHPLYVLVSKILSSILPHPSILYIIFYPLYLLWDPLVIYLNISICDIVLKDLLRRI